jgi:hypothetical protein
MLVAGKNSLQQLISKHREQRKDRTKSKMTGYNKLYEDFDKFPATETSHSGHPKVELVMVQSRNSTGLRPSISFGDSQMEKLSNNASEDMIHNVLHSNQNFHADAATCTVGQPSTLGYSATSDSRSRRNDDGKITTKFLILDFGQVIGIDATS